MAQKFIPYGFHFIDEKDVDAVVGVLKGSWLTTGPKIEEFEKAICNYIGSRHAVVVNSGTAALELAVKCLELPMGSEIITTPFTFAATINAILFNNLKPVLADIRQDTFNINPVEIEKKITDNTKAIIIVDYAGQPCDFDAIKKIAVKHNLFIIEDAAHAIGAKYGQNRIGSLGDITTFSFHPVKHITTGEGGVISTDNKDFYDKLLKLRNHGIDKDTKDRFGKNASYSYDIKYLSRNFRITDFQCALGISQLKKLDGFLKKRQKIVDKYNAAFADVKDITSPVCRDGVTPAWHLYTILLSENIGRDKFFTAMRQAGIGVNVHYIPVYHHTYYKKTFGWSKEDFPVTENVFSRIITLPLYPTLTDEEVEYVILTTKKILEAYKN